MHPQVWALNSSNQELFSLFFVFDFYQFLKIKPFLSAADLLSSFLIYLACSGKKRKNICNWSNWSSDCDNYCIWNYTQQQVGHESGPVV